MEASVNGNPIDPSLIEREEAIEIISQIMKTQGWNAIAFDGHDDNGATIVSVREGEF